MVNNVSMRKLLAIIILLLAYGYGNAQEQKGYTFEEFQAEFKDDFDNFESPRGTYFWDEFKEYEAQYNLTKDESKLLGQWLNVTSSSNNNRYAFFPNKLFVLKFLINSTKIVGAKNIYFGKALGIWEIANGMVSFTIYAIVTEDRDKDYPNNKDMFFVERPYTIDFIRIDDIGEQGFTRRPINDTVLSAELQQMVTTVLNRTKNLYVRNIYSWAYTTPGVPKDYGYFKIVPTLARERLTGLAIAKNRALIERFIFPMFP